MQVARNLFFRPFFLLLGIVNYVSCATHMASFTNIVCLAIYVYCFQFRCGWLDGGLLDFSVAGSLSFALFICLTFVYRSFAIIIRNCIEQKSRHGGKENDSFLFMIWFDRNTIRVATIVVCNSNNRSRVEASSIKIQSSSTQYR